MPEMKLQLIAAAFPDRDCAGRALEKLIRATPAAGGIIEAVAATRSADGPLQPLRGSRPGAPGEVLVSPLTVAVLALLAGAAARSAAHPDLPPTWNRTARKLVGQFRDVAALLTPASSVLVTIVEPTGAAEVAGVVLNEAQKLAVEDLPTGAVRALAAAPVSYIVPDAPVSAPISPAPGR